MDLIADIVVYGLCLIAAIAAIALLGPKAPPPDGALV